MDLTLFDLNLRHLRALPALVATGNMSAAAQLANLSQPALTQGTAKLERQLNADLFIRQPDGTHATDAGRQFAGRVAAALTHLARGARLGARLGGSIRPNKGAPERLMTATQLRAFADVADHGGFAGAAAASGRSQPTIHRAVRELEAVIGRQLVVRSGRGTRLTAAGEAMARGVRLTAAEIASGLAELHGPDSRHTRLRIGAMPLSRAQVIPQAIARFTRRYPQALVEVTEGAWRDLVEPLRDGRLDLTIGAVRPTPPPDIVQTPLFHDRLNIIARAGHPLAGPTMPAAAALAGYPWIVGQAGTPLRQRFEALFGAQHPLAHIECGSVMVIRGILCESDHLTILSYDQVALEVEAGVLATVGPPPAGASRTIGLSTRRDWRPTAVQQVFLDLISAGADHHSSHF